MSQVLIKFISQNKRATQTPRPSDGGVRITRCCACRAEDEAQTRDPQLGRLMLYQLSYFRKNIPYQSQPSPRGAVLATCFGICNSDRLFSFFEWEVMDSNHRRRTPADLQSAPFGHSGNFPCFSPVRNWHGLFPFYPGLTSLRSTCVSRRSSFPFGEAFVLPPLIVVKSPRSFGTPSLKTVCRFKQV